MKPVDCPLAREGARATPWVTTPLSPSPNTFWRGERGGRVATLPGIMLSAFGMRRSHVPESLSIILALSLAFAVPSYAQTPSTSAELPFDKTSKVDLNNYRVRLVTSFGDIEIDLFPHFAQGHVRNFLNLSKLGLYGGTAWHRIVPGFVIQGGAIDTRLPPVSPQDRAQFVHRLKPEFNRLVHEEGTVSMARAAGGGQRRNFFLHLPGASKVP